MISEYLPAIGNHLWQSTLFAGLVAILALLLKKNRAAVRYRLWLAASLKFLLPFSLLIGIGRQMEWPSYQVKTPAALVAAVEGISQPLTVAPTAVSQKAGSLNSLPEAKRPASTVNRVPLAVLLVWLCGAAVVLLLWLREWRRMRISLRAASPVDTDLPIPVLMTAMPTWFASRESRAPISKDESRTLWEIVWRTH